MFLTGTGGQFSSHQNSPRGVAGISQGQTGVRTMIKNLQLKGRFRSRSMHFELDRYLRRCGFESQDKRGRMIYQNRQGFIVAFYADCCCRPKPSGGTDMIAVWPDGSSRYEHCDSLVIGSVRQAFSSAAVEASPLGTGLFVADIRHDSWCAIFQGGACNCDPDVEIARG